MELIETKAQAIELFGETSAYGVMKLAEALAVSRQQVYQWPEKLPVKLQDRILGAAIRLGIIDELDWRGPDDG